MSTRLETIRYRDEDYQIEVYHDEDGFTTTETDQIWWEDLRRQYITRHPEVLEEFIRSFPGKIEEVKEGIWKAHHDGETRQGRTKEEAIKNLYICLAI